MKDDPFAALGLPTRAGLSDEDVRAAWKRIAAATHPDRDDGGDSARFGAAAAAYDTLRTAFGRGEALADLGLAGSARRIGRRQAQHARRDVGHGLGHHLGAGGRGGRVVLRAVVAVGATAAVVLAAGWTPATVGLVVGVLTALAVTSRADLQGRDGLSRGRGKNMGYKVPLQGPEVSHILSGDGLALVTT